MKKQTVWWVIVAGLALLGALVWRSAVAREKPADADKAMSADGESGMGVPQGWKSVEVIAGQTAEASDKGIEVRSTPKEDKPQVQGTDEQPMESSSTAPYRLTSAP